MTLARTHSVCLLGVRGHLIEVVADLAAGLPRLSLIGLPDAALAEARDRVHAAVINSGQAWPTKRITLALSPADLRKHGSGFDVALAAVVLCGSDVIPQTALDGVVLLGELGLDGSIRPVRGILPSMLAAARSGIRRAIVPSSNAAEAALVPDLQVCGVPSLRELVAHLCGEPANVVVGEPPDLPAPPVGHDLADVAGQAHGRRALEIAAAGGHHLYLSGPPGAGKTMLAERLPGILPPLSHEEALEVTAVHSVAGLLPPDAPIVGAPPFQSPHHTASVAALVGGGSGLPRPGAVSCAHRGVLFLDEAPEMAAGTLDALREPMERGEVLIARSGGAFTFPARFQLILASNPCPCASPAGDIACSCPPMVRRRYLARLSGPLLDRVDLRVRLFPLARGSLLAEASEMETSQVVARRVAAARGAAAERLKDLPSRTNAEIPGPVLRSRWRLPASVVGSATHALERGAISARGFDRVLRSAWTIADLAGRTAPTAGDVDEAVGFRLGEVAA